MCFSIPQKVIQINGKRVVLEGGHIALLEDNLKLKAGDFVRYSGSMIVDKLTKNNALKIRRLIKKLNS